jgi:hypothetical protein
MSGSGDQAVIADFDYVASDLQPLFALEEELETAIESAGVGELDGNEVAVDLSDGSLCMYGPDAEALFAVVRPILAASACLRNVRVTLWLGDREDSEKRVYVLDG